MISAQVAWVSALCSAAVLLVAGSAVMLIREARRRELEGRAVHAVWGAAAATEGASGLAELVGGLGDRIRRGTRLYSRKDLEHLKGLILAAGFKPAKVLPVVIAAKLLVMFLVPILSTAVAALAIESLAMRIVLVAAGVIVGIIGPEWVLSWLRRPYEDALQRGMPDALDLLVICGEAGMGLESALERVSGEMQKSNSPMAIVLAGLLDDLRILPDRGQAFRNFGNRTGIEGLQRLGTMLGQSLQYGTPLSRALRAVAIDLRRERMNDLEEKAVRLPALLVFPMIFFIMPSLYIVLLGPSFMRLFDALDTFAIQLPTH